MTKQVAASHAILVTRPEHQAGPIMQQLKARGFYPIPYPTISIVATSPTPFLEGLKRNIQSFDMALFVSRNAVDFAFNWLDKNTLPLDLQLGVIGKGSWLALKQQGVASHIIPAENYNSEGLLDSAALKQVKDKNILIFRGQQGRNLLGDTLRDRGAEVTYCEVYRREVPHDDKHRFSDLTQQRFPDLAIFTSAEGLLNCFELLDDSQANRLRNIPWLLISERMRETARNLGHNADIMIATKASDEGIMQALEMWQKQRFE